MRISEYNSKIFRHVFYDNRRWLFCHAIGWARNNAHVTIFHRLFQTDFFCWDFSFGIRFVRRIVVFYTVLLGCELKVFLLLVTFRICLISPRLYTAIIFIWVASDILELPVAASLLLNSALGLRRGYNNLSRAIMSIAFFNKAILLRTLKRSYFNLYLTKIQSLAVFIGGFEVSRCPVFGCFSTQQIGHFLLKVNLAWVQWYRKNNVDAWFEKPHASVGSCWLLTIEIELGEWN